jgi:membrane protein
MIIKMIDVRKKINNFFVKDLWDIDTGSLNGFKSFLIRTLRLLNVAFREFTEGQLTLRAMSLVYTTLLSIVPILAISFSVLKAFGVHNEVVEPFLQKFLAPLGAKGTEITSRIIGFVENMKVGVLGSIGLGMLFYTVVSVIQKVEKSFNAIWRIRKSRSFARRFSDYISVMIIGPVLIFSAIGLTATFMSNTFVQMILSIEPFGSLFNILIKLLPYVIVCGAFTFIYMLIPNTKVHFKSAVTGGVLAGVLWETAGWAFASFIVSSAKYAAIYSGFAILIMFMIWIYLNWLILLVGAQISFYHQYPHVLSTKNKLFFVSNRLRERLAFLIMYFIGLNYYHNKPPWTVDSLVQELKLPLDPVHDMVSVLQKNGLILETADDPPAYVPARDIETISLAELLRIVRMVEKESLNIEKKVISVPDVESVLKALEESTRNVLGERTLKDVVLSRPYDI